MNMAEQSIADQSLDWSFHPDHASVVSEPHARPSLPIYHGDRIHHLGLQCGEDAQVQLLELLDIDTEKQPGRHWITANDTFRLKFENHTEFLSITLIFAEDSSEAENAFLLKKIADTEGVSAISLTRIIIAPMTENVSRFADDDGGKFGGLMRGEMIVRASLVPNEAGFITYNVVAANSSPEETGRRIQRLMEMETYRTLSMLGLPLARRTGGTLSQQEAELIDIVSEMNAGDATDDDKFFQRLSALLQETQTLRASTRFRFAASRAYYDLVQQRLNSLEEDKLNDLQTISGFVRSRLDPSMATIESIATRQVTLIDDLSQALSLLRTRIELAVNRDNQNLLMSLNDRHRQQLMIAQTVEGLSAVAITYYAVGLLSYIFKSVVSVASLPISENILVAVSVPIVLFVVWTSLHRLRKRWDKD